LASIRSETRDDLRLVSIDPPVLGQDYDLGACDIDTVVIAPRREGQSLEQVHRSWPVAVYVLLLSVPYSGQSEIPDADMRLVAWAEIYPSGAALREHLGEPLRGESANDEST
jgi:hypothetical protein